MTLYNFFEYCNDSNMIVELLDSDCDSGEVRNLDLALHLKTTLARHWARLLIQMYYLSLSESEVQVRARYYYLIIIILICIIVSVPGISGLLYLRYGSQITISLPQSLTSLLYPLSGPAMTCHIGIY